MTDKLLDLWIIFGLSNVMWFLAWLVLHKRLKHLEERLNDV